MTLIYDPELQDWIEPPIVESLNLWADDDTEEDWSEQERVDHDRAEWIASGREC